LGLLNYFKNNHHSTLYFSVTDWGGSLDTNYVSSQGPTAFYWQLIRINLDTVQRKGDVIYSGLNNLASDPQIILENDGASSACQIDIYVLNDVLMVIQNGIVRVAL